MDSSRRRKSLDITKLMTSNHAVELVNDGDSELIVEFKGPKGSLYDGGIWKVRVKLPIVYPDQPPFVEFVDRIFHPNIGESSGSVCVDVLDENWSPGYDLVNVFDVFLPELLRKPNPSDPLNAAILMLKDTKLYEQKVKDDATVMWKTTTSASINKHRICFRWVECEYCERYAKKENVAPPVENESNDDKTSDGQCTSVDEDFPRDADP